MKRVSIELVPRDEASLREALDFVRHEVQADVINVPELLRLPIRSWEGAAIAKETFPAVMPHIRAMDINPDEELPMKEFLRAHDIREVLVIQGDPPQDMRRKVYPVTTVDIIKKFRAEMPEVRVYAGIDQYRRSLREEYYRTQQKLQAGAAGFFTQPFFDLRYLGLYADMLAGMEVYWGITPVLSERSQGYWEQKNNVVFPQSFQPTLAWSVAFARALIEAVDRMGASLYVMPIKTDLKRYLKEIFA